MERLKAEGADGSSWKGKLGTIGSSFSIGKKSDGSTAARDELERARQALDIAQREHRYARPECLPAEAPVYRPRCSLSLSVRSGRR